MRVHTMPLAFRTPNQIAASLAPDAATLKTTLQTLAAVKAQSASTTVELTAKAAPVVTIGLPIGKPKADVAKANAKANESLGAGCAESFLNCVKSQAISLKIYLQQIALADQHFRKAFRVALDKHRDAMREHVKATEGQPEHAVYKAAFDSAKPRISEAIGFSKAIDAGFVPNMAQGYHAIIGASVAFRNSTSSAATEGGKTGVQSVGPTQKKSRGRVALPVLDKVKNFLLSLNLTADDLVQVRSMVDTLATLAHAKDKPATM